MADKFEYDGQKESGMEVVFIKKTGASIAMEQIQHMNFAQMMLYCAQHPEILRYKKSVSPMPDHWETNDGRVLWLKRKQRQDKNLDERAVEDLCLCLSSPEEFLRSDFIREGAAAFNQQIKKIRQELNDRAIKPLEKNQLHELPTVSNNAEQMDLYFGQKLEAWLLNLEKVEKRALTAMEKIKSFFFPCYLGIEDSKIIITESRLILPTGEIQQFKKQFNRLLRRRTGLLNRALSLRNKPTISCILLGLESDCSPAFILQKLMKLKHFERRALDELVAEDIRVFAKQVAEKPHHIAKFLRPLFITADLWQTLWPGKERDIHHKMMGQLQVLRLYPAFRHNQPRIEGILRKAEAILQQQQGLC